jgi:hypothetical protein
MALTGRVFPNPPPPEYTWVQVVSVSDKSCEIDIPTKVGIELLGDARNQYILWHRRDVILNASPNPMQPSQELVPPPQDPDAAMAEYTMGGENNDNNMTFQDVADVGNTEQPMMVVEQGVNNNDNNMPQTPPPSGAGAGASSSPKSVPRPQTPQPSGAGASSSPKSVPRPPSPPPCPRPSSPPPATKMPTIHRMINSYEPKTKSSDVDLFLKVLKNKPKLAPTSGKESPNVQVLKKAPDEKSLSRTSFQKQKEDQISMFSSDEVPDKYEHGIPFLFRWQLNKGPSELMRLHTWIMHAMQQGIHTITANVPK